MNGNLHDNRPVVPVVDDTPDNLAPISRRCYKEPMSHGAASALILEDRGLHFAPEVVDAFVRIADRFQAIAEEFKE